MRRFLAVVLVLAGCTAPANVPAGDAGTPVPTPGERVASETPPGELPAAAPSQPTLADFRREARRACATASATLTQAPLRGDPLLAGASPGDVGAAVAHLRTAAAAWTTAAGQLWDFGVPRKRAARGLITALDTVAQYSQQAAQRLEEGDRAGAQATLGAVDSATADANVLATAIGLGRIDECGGGVATIDGARRTRVFAGDFSFSVDVVRAGPTRFVVRNVGDEPHQLFVVRLREPGTLAAAIRADRAGQAPGRYLRGRPSASPVIAPGEQGRLDKQLRPGAYALLCFVASEDGTPHAYKGMATEVTAG